MNEKTRTALMEANASDRLMGTINMLPKVIAGASFLGAHHKLRIQEVEVAIYYSERKEKAVGAYIYGRINSDPAVNLFLEESFSLHVGPQGGVKEFILRTFGGAYSFGTATRRKASMYNYYWRNVQYDGKRSLNEDIEVHEDAVEVKISRL